MDWEITRPNRHCEACGKGFGEEEELFSALRDHETDFVRQDYCPACWATREREGFFSFWKTRIPPRDEPPRRFVDDEVLVNFFHRLEGEEEPLKVNFRFVLALLLIRKKLMTFKSLRREGDSEWLVLHDKAEDREREVLNPNLTEEEIGAVTEECGKLLNMRL